MAQEITITRKGHLLMIEPPMELLLRPHLTYVRVQMDKNEQFTSEKVAIYGLDGNRLVTLAGFFERIVKVFDEMGYEYKVEDLRPQNPRLKPHVNRIPGKLRDDQIDALKAIITHDHGIIVAPTAYGKSHLIRLICSIYPYARIVICVPGIAMLDNYARRLLETIPKDDIGILGGGKHDDEKRITVVTKASLGRAPLRHCDMLLFDEVHQAAAQSVFTALSELNGAKAFGFTASPKGRSDRAEKRIEAIFGPVIFSYEYEDAVNAGSISQIRVIAYRVDKGPNVSQYKRRSTRMRKGIWYNNYRNRLIAHITRLEEFRDKQMLVYVSTAQHAIVLGKYMPDFEICYDRLSPASYSRLLSQGIIDDSFPKELSVSERRRIQVGFESGEIRKVIVTPMWNVGVDFTNLEVLIRADAGFGEIDNIQVPGRLSRLADGKEVGILVDFEDEFDPYFVRRWAARRRSYASRGWEICRRQLTLSND